MLTVCHVRRIESRPKMKNVWLLVVLSLTAGCADDEPPATWDCGEECIVGCAFLSPKKQMICKADCMICDDRVSPVFTSPPEDAGPPKWLETDAGRE